MFHDGDCGFVGDALTLEEAGLEAGFFHGAGDGFAAAVDDDGVHFDGFEEDDIAGDSGADGGVIGVHEAAAVFHDESGAAIFLDIGERFEQRFGFGDQALHGGG